MDNRMIIDNVYYELLPREIFQKIWCGIPADFYIMDRLVRLIKYPNISESALIYTSQDTTCNIIFSKLNIEMEQKNFLEFVNQNIKIISFQLPSAEVKNNELFQGKFSFPAQYFSYKIPCLDFDCFNGVYYILFRKSILITTFNCLYSKNEGMKPLFNMIINTLENCEGFS